MIRTHSVIFCLLSVLLFVEKSEAEIELLSPTKGETISTVSTELRSFLDLEGEERRTKYMAPEYRRGMRKAVQPQPYSFTWECTNGEEGPFVVRVYEGAKAMGKLPTSYSTSAVPDKPAAYVLDVTPEKEAGAMRVDLVNFLIDHEYSWQVEGIKNGKKVSSKRQVFQIDYRPPRLIELPKVGNVRDIGGWVGLDERKVRQGMIYRSNGLDFNSPERGDDTIKNAKKKPGENRLTEQALAYLPIGLGWKTELDLRTLPEVGSMSSSPAGPSVQWINRPSTSYKGLFGRSRADVTIDIFRLFLDPANYPIDIHCITGADRTGSLVFLLNGLLGVSEQDLSRDWELSWYSPLNYKERFDPMLARLKAEYGEPEDPIHKKIKAFLYKNGITPEEVAKFREIMLEQPFRVGEGANS